MKKSVFLAIIGAAALTGCQNEVMKQREYVPAPREDAEAITAPAPAFSDRSGGQTAQETAPETAPKDAPASAPEKRGGAAAQEFPPMTGSFSNTGISDADAAGAAAAAGSEYIVKRGDTLGKIAAMHRVKLSALMKANRLSEKDARKLHVGKKLIIPGGKDAAVKDGKSAKNGKRGKGGKRAFGGASSAAAELQPGEYIVKSGDTPERIARRAGVKLSALMEANNFTEESARRLRIGQKIVIPGRDAAPAKSGKSVAKGEKKAAKTETAAPAAAKTKPAAKTADDDLVNEMESSTVKDAKAAPAAAPAADAGTTVVATAPAADTERTSYVQVNEDISIEAFARQHGTTPDVIRQLNPDLTGGTLVKNRIYEVPKK